MISYIKFIGFLPGYSNHHRDSAYDPVYVLCCMSIGLTATMPDVALLNHGGQVECVPVEFDDSVNL